MIFYLNKQGRAIGSVFDEVYDQVQPYLSRRGYTSNDPDKVLSLNDQFVKDLKTAQSLGLVDQYRMIEIFKEMLLKRMKAEAQQQTVAGEVFRQWEQKWNRQGEDGEKMRRRIIDLAVEKFFTADNLAATKEFAESSDGTYGLFMNSNLDDSITFYADNQDVAIGLNRTEGYYGAASDPRVLKSVGEDGEKFEEVIHLKDGEIANISVSPSGKMIFRSWMRIGGEWKESTKKELEERFYPTAEYVDGKKNEYYAPPAVEYKNQRKIVQEDNQNTSKILAHAQAELDDPHSFNAQSTEYLSQRIADVIKKNGKARLVLVGFDNSYMLSQQFKTIGDGLFERSKLAIDVIESNKFSKSPSAYNIQPDDIVLSVSKSGATFSTKLALRLLKLLVNPENIFCMGARIDSVLNTVIGQGLRPGKDKFTKRVFVTGEFYPAETPVVSEVLLAFQLQQLVYNLARKLQPMNARQRSNIVKLSAPRLKMVAQKVTAESFRLAQELSGFDINGNPYANADQKKEQTGTYMGKVAKEQFLKGWFMKLFVGGVLLYPALLLNHYLGLGLLGTVIDVFFLSNLVPFLYAKYYRKKIGRPKNAAHGIFQLFIAAPESIHKTQRNFFSRLMTNRFSLIGPTEPLGGDPEVDFTSQFASAVKPGDIILRFFLSHKASEGRMGVNQTGFPAVETFGPSIRGKAEIRDVEIKVNHPQGATKDEIDLMDNSVGFLGMMIASKKIGVTMGDEASYGGRLFNLAATFSSAGVYTTQINPISAEARKMLDSDREKYRANGNGNGNNHHLPAATIDRPQVIPVITDELRTKRIAKIYARPATRGRLPAVTIDRPQALPIKNNPPQVKPVMTNELRTKRISKIYTRVAVRDRAMVYAHTPGGIVMNDRLMKLNIIGDDENGVAHGDNAIPIAAIKGIVLQVSGIVNVTPEMLKSMIGSGYLN